MPFYDTYPDEKLPTDVTTHVPVRHEFGHTDSPSLDQLTSAAYMTPLALERQALYSQQRNQLDQQFTDLIESQAAVVRASSQHQLAHEIQVARQQPHWPEASGASEASGPFGMLIASYTCMASDDCRVPDCMFRDRETLALIRSHVRAIPFTLDEDEPGVRQYRGSLKA